MTSRYDREAAFFDSLRDFGQRHPIGDKLLAIAIMMAFYTLFFVGPIVGLLTLDWLLGRDPYRSDGLMAAGALGGSTALTALTFAAVGIHSLARRVRA